MSFGLPSGQQESAFAPPPIQDFGATPQVNASYASAAGYNPTYANASLVDPNQSSYFMNLAYGQNAQALQPTFAQQDQNLADQNAGRGITKSGAGAQLTNDLYGQQGAALAAADAPITSQGYSYNQQDILGNQAALNTFGLANAAAANTAGQFNAGNQQQTNFANQNAANAATGANANYYNQDRTGNANAYDQFMNELYGSSQGYDNALLNAYLGTYAPNPYSQGLLQSGTGQVIGGYNNAFDSAVSGQDSALTGAGTAAGNYFGQQG